MNSQCVGIFAIYITDHKIDNVIFLSNCIVISFSGSKFALEGFSESMKYELEGFGIKVILIVVITQIGNNFLENLKQGQQAMNPDSPYAELSRKVSEGVRESFKQASSSSPVQVAEVILNAIKSENPNTRYLVGNDAAAIMERRKKSSDF